MEINKEEENAKNKTQKNEGTEKVAKKNEAKKVKNEKIDNNIKEKSKIKESEENLKDDNNSEKFKRVEIKKDSKANKKIEKPHRFIKAILIIIGILVVLYLIFTMRNYVIIKDLMETISKMDKVHSCSYETVSKIGNTETNIKYCRKDNIIRIDFESSGNSVINITAWQDTDTNEEIIAFDNENKNIAIKSNNDKILATDDGFIFNFIKLSDYLNGLGLYALIYTDEYNGRECYVIQESANVKMWIEKETGLLLKQQTSEDRQIECLSVEINNVQEIYKPDLTDYEIESRG